MKSFFAAIGNFFKRALTKHNAVAAGVTVARAAKTVGDVASGNIAAALTDGAATIDAAKSFTAVEKPASAPVAPSTSTSSAS